MLLSSNFDFALNTLGNVALRSRESCSAVLKPSSMARSFLVGLMRSRGEGYEGVPNRNDPGTGPDFRFNDFPKDLF